MKIKLLYYTPLIVCANAIRTCWQSFDKSDNGGEVDKKLIDRVGNKYKHSSTLVHIWYTFKVTGWNEHVKQELLENKYVIISNDILTLNLRALKDMYTDGKYLPYRNEFLTQLYHGLPQDHIYLVDKDYRNFINNIDMDNNKTINNL